jgi:hypothetical protein
MISAEVRLWFADVVIKVKEQKAAGKTACGFFYAQASGQRFWAALSVVAGLTQTLQIVSCNGGLIIRLSAADLAKIIVLKPVPMTYRQERKPTWKRLMTFAWKNSIH